MKHKTLLSYLKKYHFGAEKAASSGVLEAAFSITSRGIRTIVNSLRSDGNPICSGETGYYYAASVQELQA